MSEKVELFLDNITKTCQQAARAKVRQELSALKKDNKRLASQNRAFAIKIKELESKRDVKAKELVKIESRIIKREADCKKAMTFIADKMDALEKIEKQSLKYFLDHITSNRNYWYTETPRAAVAKIRRELGRHSKASEKKPRRRRVRRKR